MPIKVKCPICGKITKKKPSQKNVCCSNLCGQKLRTLNAQKRHEQNYDKYVEWYCLEKLSFRQISKMCGLDTRTLQSAFIYLGIPIRKGSVAIKNQWMQPGNKERRKFASNLAKQNLIKNKDGTRTKPYLKAISNYQHRQWRKAVKERDNHTCRICGAKLKILHAHHIKNILDYPKLQYSLKNGITLCPQCHGKVHAKTLSLNSIFSVKS